MARLFILLAAASLTACGVESTYEAEVWEQAETESARSYQDQINQCSSWKRERNRLTARQSDLEAEFDQLDCNAHDYTSDNGMFLTIEDECVQLRDEYFRIEGRLAYLDANIRVYCRFGAY